MMVMMMMVQYHHHHMILILILIIILHCEFNCEMLTTCVCQAPRAIQASTSVFNLTTCLSVSHIDHYDDQVIDVVGK